jgi:hypothetical protein
MSGTKIFRTALAICALSAFAAGARAAGEPSFEDVPNACGLLTEPLAMGWLRSPVNASAANEHIPTFSSQCIYAGRGVASREVRFVFKFMLDEMFDIDALIPEQLTFNATFASGGLPPSATLTDLGRVSFAYERDPITLLLVVTGIRGPDDGAGRPTVFVASYQLSDPPTPHSRRLDTLIDVARQHLAMWQAQTTTAH